MGSGPIVKPDPIVLSPPWRSVLVLVIERLACTITKPCTEVAGRLSAEVTGKVNVVVEDGPSHQAQQANDPS